MTLDEFLDELRKTPRDWYLEYKHIRRPCGINGQCPITSLHTGSYLSPSSYMTVARNLKIDSNLANQIATTADYDGTEEFVPEEFNSTLRAHLLAACGLEEKANT